MKSISRTGKCWKYSATREDFFREAVFPYHLGALSYAAPIAVLGIDLSQPASVAVAGRTHLDLGVEVSEEELL